ncbi:MAG: hypothetical protein LBE53_01760 [Paucimonas sp.]|jgi:hypothetical protein|nr:hypothetical protein [Paucimonas sp.]
MITKILRILASALRRPTPAATPSLTFYLIDSHSLATRANREVPMSDHERMSSIQSYVWTLELLGEALVQHDEVLECEYNPQLSFRNTSSTLCCRPFRRIFQK